jgi:uncharacterized RDD family membrane protein YckC
MANPYAPPQAIVGDVNKSAGFVRADPGTRLGAALLDGLIMAGMTALPMLAILLAGTPFIGRQPGGGGSLFVALVPLLGLVGAIMWCWLTIKYVRENGQTIGKRIIGIKVIRTDGSPVSLGRIFWLRNVVNALLGVIPLYNMIEVLFIFGEQRQCLHDKIADTIVVRA